MGWCLESPVERGPTVSTIKVQICVERTLKWVAAKELKLRSIIIGIYMYMIMNMSAFC